MCIWRHQAFALAPDKKWVRVTCACIRRHQSFALPPVSVNDASACNCVALISGNEGTTAAHGGLYPRFAPDLVRFEVGMAGRCRL